MIVYLDGEWCDGTRARVSVFDAGFLHGDAVFETARLHRGGYFRLPEHLARLAEGAAMLQLPVPAPEALTRIAGELARRNGVGEGTLRITITRGVPGQGPTVLVTLQPVPRESIDRAERGWRLATAKMRRPPLSSVPAQLKTPGRIYSLLARLEPRPVGVDDVLLLTEPDTVCEGPSWNIFWRRGAQLRTPSAAAGALAGVTRTSILELAPAAGFTVEAGEWSRAELDDVEEIFVTMSSLGVVAVRALDGRSLGSDAAARLLHARYWEMVAREVSPRHGE